ncbi:S8 family peptidase [Solibacillus silvestris]|uniref:S8 family peptidase n=1 Tax=Solibacillus silvestris TaxID=76853 RepID=UPI003F801D78
MRKILVCGIVLLVILTLQPLSLKEAFASNLESNVIVKYMSEPSKQIIIENAESVIEEFEHLPLINIKMTNERLQFLKDQGHIEFYEENQTFTIQHQFKVANLSSVELERWNIKAMNIHNSWNEGYTGKGVKIAIIDSGVANHPDLTLAGGVSFIGDSYDDDHGHGTHVAGIIAAKHNGVGVAGIAPNAEVYAVKAIKKDGLGEVGTVLQAIDWAIENKMDIINLSFGDLEYAPSLHEGIKKAAEHGIIIVAASGNEGNDSGTGNTINYPARHEEAISVAAVNRHFKRSSFSGTGDANDFAAPGEEIYSTYLNGQYATYNGTSMATPHIAGLLALLMEQYPYAEAAELRDGLRYIAEDLGEAGFDALYGHGFPKFQSPNGQIVDELLNSGLSSEALHEKIEKMPSTIEKLALKNEWNKTQQTVIQEIDQILADFMKNPTEQRHTQLTELLAKMASADVKVEKQKEIDAAISALLEPAANAVNIFSKNKTVYNYKKADAELEKLPALKAKQELESALNEALQEFAEKAIQSLAQYEKQPTKDHYNYANFSINNLPDSSIKSDLLEKLNKKVQAAVKQATTNIAAYEKVQTLKNYNSAAKTIQLIFDEKQREQLEKRIKKTVDNNLAKAKLRAANYEKKKTKANHELAMKLVRELPNGKDKEQLLKRLK